jgi:hypothetical protein
MHALAAPFPIRTPADAGHEQGDDSETGNTTHALQRASAQATMT